MSTLRHSYFSVGEYCATAHQIRRVSGVDDAYVFDWLITHGDSFRFLVEPDETLLVSGQWSLVDGGLRLRDHGTGWLYQHEFETDATGMIDPARVEAHLPVAREKFTYLKHKTLNALRNCPSGVMIRQESGLTAETASARMDQLREIFRPLNPALKFVVASPHIEQQVFAKDQLLLHVDLPPASLGADGWMGDNASWSRLFEEAESHFSPGTA